MTMHRRQGSPYIAAGLIFGLSTAPLELLAGEIADSYSPNQTLTADMMNNIKSAVNDNNSRINSNSAMLAAQEDAINSLTSQLEALGLRGSCEGNNENDVMVVAGTLCVDKYEASLWSDNTAAATASTPGGCDADGGNCTFVAQSRGAVAPASSVSYLQAAAACANAGKRLLTPGEYQVAALGTPAASCNISTDTLANTGASAGCVSRDNGNGGKTSDMVGNLFEFVDAIAFGPGGVPQAGYMGSSFSTGDTADAQRFFANVTLVSVSPRIGFRCAR